jgi:hypothetical protein
MDLAAINKPKKLFLQKMWSREYISAIEKGARMSILKCPGGYSISSEAQFV